MLGIGSHSIKAIFGGTRSALASSSTAQSVAVTGMSPTGTLISLSGAAGSYSVTGTVGYMGLAAPGSAESVTFVDTTNGNLQVGTGPLGTPASPQYAFTTVTDSPFGSGVVPVDIAVGDFNGDGIPDLAVANFTANTVSIYSGSSAGTYSALGSSIAVGSKPISVRSGDFNSDGFLDLVVVNAGDGTFTVLLGDGKGDFTAKPATSTLGAGPASVAILDANDDGIPDLALVNELASTLSVFLGDGTGSFAATSASPIETGGNPSSIVSADFNGDGLADIAFTNMFDGTVSIMLGDGTGAFSDNGGSPYTVTAGPSSLVVGDFNGDGRPDLAVLDATANQLTTLLNETTGIAAAGPPVATGASAAGGISGDFNGDGDQDLAVTNANDSTVTVFFGDGSGEFSASKQSLLSNFNAAQAIVGLNAAGNGLTDIAVTNMGGASVSIRDLTVAQMASTAALPLTVYGGGTHQVQANYGGDASYTPSSSPSVSVMGSLVPSTSTVSLSPASTVAYGSAVQLTSTVSPGSQDNYTETGTVTFKDGSSTLGQASLSGGQAAMSLNSLAPGSHSITSAYSGDANFAASSSAASPLTVAKAGTSTTLVASSGSGTTIPLTATVVSSTSGTPTGSVGFYDGATLLNTTALANGVAAWSVASLSTGTHSLTAIYSGDANYNASTSPAVTEAVNGFTISATGSSGTSGSSAPTQTAVPGGTATFGLSIGPTSGVFPAPVTLSVSGLPNGATATLTPSMLPAGSSLTNVTLTIQLPQQSGQLIKDDRLGQSLPPAVLGLLVLPFFFRRTRASAKPKLMLLLLVLLGGVAGGLMVAGWRKQHGLFRTETAELYGHDYCDVRHSQPLDERGSYCSVKVRIGSVGHDTRTQGRPAYPGHFKQDFEIRKLCNAHRVSEIG